MARVKIVTGEYVEIEQHMASVSDRLFAQMLDIMFQIVYIIAVSTTISLSFMSSTHEERIVMTIIIFAALPVIFYHPLCEYFFGGASAGKHIMKLKVVMQDGSTPTLGAYLIRWVMFLVECMILPGVGLLCIIFNRHGQRLGDMMAGTIVVKNKKYIYNGAYIPTFGYVPQDYRPYYPEVANLSVAQANVVRDTLYLYNDNRAYYISLLSEKIRETLNIPPLMTNNDELFLTTVLNDYCYYSATIKV